MSLICGYNISDSNITVVATGVSSGNDVGMPPHIQILSTDTTEQQQHHSVSIQDSKLTNSLY